MFFTPKQKPKTPPRISLSLPKSWNQLDTGQLEGVSRILIDCAKKFTATGDWSHVELMTRSFFLLSGLEIVGGPFDAEEEIVKAQLSKLGQMDDGDMVDEMQESIEEFKELLAEGESYYLCQYKDEKLRNRYQTWGGEIRDIRITMNEIRELTIGHYELDKGNESKLVPGPLGWILKRSDLTIFPYQTLQLPDTHAKRIGRKYPMVDLRGPEPLMDGTSWRQYRISTDIMQYLQKAENNLLTIQKNSARYGTERLNEQKKLVDEVRAQFLANIFCRSIPHIDPETGQTVEGFYYVSSQQADNAYLFEGFPEEKFQAILLWWQGMMLYLSRQFPKVFRTEKNLNKESSLNDPLKLYTRSITTMIKYAAESEEEVNRSTYTVILQHMNDMADENDRMKEIKSKH